MRVNLKKKPGKTGIVKKRELGALEKKNTKGELKDLPLEKTEK